MSRSGASVVSQSVSINPVSSYLGDRISKHSRKNATGSLPINYIEYTVPAGKALDIENWYSSGEGKGLIVMDIDDEITEYEIDAIRINAASPTEDRITAWFGVNTPLRICAGSTIRLKLLERQNSNTEYITGFNATLRNVANCSGGASGGQLS